MAISAKMPRYWICACICAHVGVSVPRRKPELHGSNGPGDAVRDQNRFINIRKEASAGVRTVGGAYEACELSDQGNRPSRGAQVMGRGAVHRPVCGLHCPARALHRSQEREYG